MARCIKLRNHFYSMDLHYGKTMLKPYREFHCFFIVDHSCDKDFMRQQALQLLLSQCHNYEFHGTYCREWELAFDEVDIILHPNDGDEISLTNSWKDIDAFVDTLELTLSLSSFVPFDVYLIYDDDAIYQAVLNKLEEKI